MITTSAEASHESIPAAFYRSAIETIRAAGVPFLVGGAFALQRYTGLARDTKDIDLFVYPHDVERALRTFEAAGYRTDLTFPHWLAKAYCGEYFIDIIFSSGNGVSVVDDSWFAFAIDDEVMGVPVKLCPAEEMLWSKAFIMERERYDGADIAHLLRATATGIDWQRLVRRFNGHWRVLLSHLTLFGYVYPSERALIPDWVMLHLLQRLETDTQLKTIEPHVCNGTFLSRAQYLVDIEEWGYGDSRVAPDGTMTPEDTAVWTTAAIEDENVTIAVSGEPTNQPLAAADSHSPWT
jgi:hypothetical protein